jgi:hypothetical protein
LDTPGPPCTPCFSKEPESPLQLINCPDPMGQTFRQDCTCDAILVCKPVGHGEDPHAVPETRSSNGLQAEWGRHFL